jgi:hypothetical protein
MPSVIMPNVIVPKVVAPEAEILTLLWNGRHGRHEVCVQLVGLGSML